MANVQFKRGTQAALEALTSFAEGAFYLTTDSHRLYTGIKDGEEVKLVDLNQYIRFYERATDLPTAVQGSHVNDMAYIKEGNILAVFTGEGSLRGWKQVNANTDTYRNTTYTGTTDPVVATTNADGDVEIEFSLTGTTKDESGNVVADSTPAVTQKIKIPKDVVNSMVTDATVSVGATSDETNTAKIKTNGTGSAGEGFQIKGNGGTVVSVSNGNVVISSAAVPTYELSSAANSTQIKLSQSGTTDKGTVTIQAANGEKSLSVTGTTENTINIAHTAYEGTKTDGTEVSAAAGSSSIVAVSALELENGHIKGYTLTPYKLPNAINPRIQAVSGSYEGGTLSLSVTGPYSDNVVTDTVENLNFTIGDGDVKATYNLGSELPVYTKDEINDKFRGLDGMTYRGTVGQMNSAIDNLQEIHVGDTYKATTNGTTEGKNHVSYKSGDILIAKGTETNGVVAYDDVEWDVIPSGNTDTTYSVKSATVSSGTGAAMAIVPSTNSSDLTKKMDFVQGTNIAVASGTGTNPSIVISHATVDGTITDNTADGIEAESIGYNGTFNVVTSISKDDYGHITGATISKKKLPALMNTTYSYSGSSTVNNNKATITNTLTGSQGSPESTTTTIASDSLTIASTLNANELKVDLEWGTF